jgi:hypothetical protein
MAIEWQNEWKNRLVKTIWHYTVYNKDVTMKELIRLDKNEVITNGF